MSAVEYIFGFHPIEALLRSNPERILELYVQHGRKDDRLLKIIKDVHVEKLSIIEVSKLKLEELTQSAQHQGIVAKCRPDRAYSEDDLEQILATASPSPFFLILDGIQDPHNLGACLRTANAAGVHAVIAPKDNSVGLTPAVRKVASGAAEITPFIQVTNLARTLRWLKDEGVWLYGTADDAEQSLFTADLKGAIAIILGAEGKGIRRLTAEHCDVMVSIPLSGTVQSLNVSVATGICLFEAVRQRR